MSVNKFVNSEGFAPIICSFIAAVALAGCSGDDSATGGSTTGDTTMTTTETSTTGETTTTTTGMTTVETTGMMEDAVCGDGLVSEGEECDNGEMNGSDGICTADCKEVVAMCGDGVLSGSEECDDGAGNGDDQACTSECLNNVCGDGKQGPGEGCDDGDANADDAACSTMCQPTGCGDGVVNGDEMCDNGEDNGNDKACTSECKENICGDGYQGPGEGCDDGNEDPNDGCDACMAISCGDGIQQQEEECDDGNADNTDGCIDTCVAASCGDGYIWADDNEICDDGNADNTDACTTLCAPPSCDDGILSGDEEDIDCGGSTCNSCYGLWQHRWKGTESVASGTWKKIAGADAPIVTRGGPLEIELGISLSAGGDSACRPTIDGEWAGKAQGLPQVATWHEGRARTSFAPILWSRVRVYYDIAAGEHTLGVECRTSSGTLKVGRAESTAVAIVREYDQVKNKIHQKVSLSGTVIGVTGQMKKLANSDLTFDLDGGDIEVAISLPIGTGGHAGCLPWMDGKPIPSVEQTYGDAFWQAGLVSTYGGSWTMWNHSRLYKDISAGTHTFSIRCYNDSGNLDISAADSASVILVRELDNAEDKVSQGHDPYGGWKISDGIDSKWYDMTEYQTTLTVEHGNIEITEFTSYYHVNAGAWFTCRPVVNGSWLGTVGGEVFSSNEEEGVAHQPYSNSHHGMWHRRRIYTGFQPGDYEISLQCLSSGNNFWAGSYGQGTFTARDVQLLGDV